MQIALRESEEPRNFILYHIKYEAFLLIAFFMQLYPLWEALLKGSLSIIWF